MTFDIGESFPGQHRQEQRIIPKLGNNLGTNIDEYRAKP
jgi:hypothetical protein